MKDWVEEHLERKHVNPFLLIGFLAITIIALIWEALKGKR